MATTDVRDLFKGNSKKKTSGITDVRDLFWTEESANEFYGGFQDRLTNWTNAQQSLISSTNDFYNNRDLSSYGLDGSNRWKETVSNRVNWLQQEADSIADILKEYGRYFDTETVNKIALTFRDSKNMSSNILKQADADIEFWNQFKGEEDYQNYYFNNKYDGKSYEEVLKALDSSSGKEKDWLTKNSQYYMSSQQAQSEIDKLTKYKSDKDSIATELNNLTSQLKNAYTRAGYGSKVEEMVESDSRVVKLREQLGDYDKSGTANRIAELTEIKGQATLKEKNKAFEAEAENDPQYSSYWAKGRAEGTSKLIAYRNDPQTGYKESAQAMRAGGGSFDSEAWKFATHMEDDEYRNYLYFLGKYGEKKANEYLDSIETSVNTREANEFAKQYEGTVVLPQLFGLYAGVSSFGEDLKGLFSDGYEAPSSTQIASGLIREDQGAVGKVFYDIANTTGRQLPTILGTAVATTFLGPTGGQIVGAGLTGASSMGGARQEMLNLGYSNAQATTYGFLTGASEAGLQYVLGGIGKVGGAWTDDAVKSFTKGLNSAGAKFAIEFGADMVSEGIEEGLQEVLDPFFKKVATGKNEGVDWGQVAYSGFLGALSAGILNGFGASVNRAGEVSLANDIKKQGKVNTLKELGNTFAADTLANKLASKVTENTGAWKIADVIHEMRGELTEQNKADIKYQLVRNGMTESDADTVSEWLGKAVDGEHFTALQKKALDNNPIISRVFKKVIIDQNSTVNQRLQAMMDVQGIEGHAGVDYSAIAKAQSKEGLTASANLQQTLKSMQTDAIKQKFGIGRTALGDTDATLDSMVSEAKKAMSNAKVSESGVTTDSSTGKQINIKRVVDTNGKVATYAMADGSTIRSSNVEYANDDEGMLYEGAISLGYSADVTNGIIHGYQAVNMPVAKYLNGIDEAIEYGRIGYPMDKISNDGFYADLPDSMKKYAYDLGKESARKETDIAQADVDGFKGKADTVKEGKVVIRSKAALTERQKTSINTVGKVVSDITHNKVVFFDTVKKGNTLVFAEDVGGHKKGTKAPNGFHDKATGTIYIDINAGQNGEGVILWTAAHELTHFIRQWSPAKFKVLADFLMAEYGKKGVDIQALIDNKIAEARANKKTITRDKAYEEVVADSMQTMFTDTNLAEKLERLKNQDKGLWEKIKAFFRDLYKKIKEAYKGLDAQTEEARLVRDMGKTIERLSDLFAEAIVDAGETFQTASNLDVVPNTDAVRVEDTTEYSFRSLAQAAGFDAVEYEDGTKAFLRNGERVKKVTVADIENSPIGALINFSLEKGDIDEAHADEQKKMFARICTLANETNDFAMAMTFMGSAVFTGMKANSDKQYGTTYDFPSICTKTQAVIDAMSAKMKRLKRGLGADEMTKLYQEVFASGNPVPCPECYVFSRWIGIGGLLDNINTYQDYYGEMGAEKAAVAYRKMYGEVEAFATENEITFGKAKGALASKVTKEYNDLKEKIEKQDNQGEKVKDADRKKLSNLEKTMNTVKAMSWLEKVYFKGNPLTEQTPKVNPKYKVPTDILFDLNMGEAFATQYKEAWAFRTTQGAGYGKAITPYAEAVIGEGILVTNNTSKTIKDKQNEKLNNIFLEQKGTLTKDAKKALERARQKQKTQAFLGGQRFQSTSDARFENASDYLIAMLEMQAMGGMVQAYTKVDGAVPAFNAWGVSTNQSLMPKNGGVDANGNLIDTNTGGMNRDKAFENRKKYEQAGTITIGVNDIHIRVLFGEVERDFVIPYHASGGNAEMVAEFRRIQDKASKKETFVRSTDYTRVQSDKVLSDDVLSWLGKSDEDIERIKANREARIAILTGGSPNMDVVRESKYLSALYDKFAKGGEWEGVKLPKGKISSTIFPNEFWDKSVTYAESRKITEDYLAYCDELGFLHRFSGTVPSNGVLKPINGYDPNGNKVQLTDLAYKYDENGNKTSEVEPFYWKVLTDRRMYGNQGQYLEQKVITLNDTTEDTVTSFAKNNTGRQYDKELSMKTAEKIANEFSQEFKDSTVKGFGITDINSYIHVQKQVFRTLVNEGFFTDAENRSRTDVNEESGMVIETNKSGIDETFNDDNYGKRGKHLKYAKLATVRMIPEVIRSGHLVGDNVKNRHDGKRVRYAYIEQSVVVDGVPMTVKVDIRKSKDKNKMWVHSIYAEKNISGQGITSEDGAVTPYQTADSGDRIAQNSDSVNTLGENSYSLRKEAPPTKTVKAYKLMRLVDRKLYPLFIGNNEEVSVGTWYNADSPNLSQLKNLAPGTHLVDMKTGEAMTWDEYAEKHVPKKNGKPTRSKPSKDDVHWANDNGYRFMHIEEKAGGRSADTMLKKYGDTRAYYNWGVNGSSKTESGEGSASLYALRPGWHFGEVPSMHQIGYDGEEGETVRLDNQVWVEVEMSADIDYNAEAEANWSGDIPTHIPTNGYYRFATNPTQKKTKSGNTANDATKADWYVAGAFKVNRIMSDSEADAIVENYNKKYGKNIPLDYRRNYGRVFNAETMSIEDSVQYSERASNATDNRTLLANALESVAQNDVERSWLAKYKSQIASLNADQEKLAELRAKIKDAMFTEGGDRKQLPALKNRADIIAERINRADKKLLNLEASKPLQKVIDRERAKAYKLGMEKLSAYRKERAESKELHYYRPRIEKIVSDLQDRLEHPSAKTAIPEVFGATIAKVLSAFNFTTYDNEGNPRKGKANATRAEARESLKALADQLGQNTIESTYGQFDVPPEMVEWIEKIHGYFEATAEHQSEEYNINKMTGEELKLVYKFLKAWQKAINNVGRYYSNASYDVMSDARSTMDYVGELPKEINETAQKASKTLKWDFASPVTVFDRFGEGGKHVYQMLVKGQSKMAYNVQEVLDFVEKAYTEKEAKLWREKLVSVNIGGTDYNVTVEMLMGLHCLLRQEDSRRHILEGGGIRFADVKYKGKVKRFENIFFNEVDAMAVEKALDNYPRAKETAESMQQFMEKVGSSWGNEISMIRFGYHAFTTPGYYPIRTVAAGSEYEAQQKRANIYALLNKSFTKERNLKANNAVIVDGIFSVFNNHMAEMALYNAWALPVIDTIKWFNYKETQDIDAKVAEKSVHETFRLAYGTYADEYVRRLLESINSQTDGGLSEELAFRNLRMVNRVAVSWNVRVAIQQPFSVARAFELINPKYVTPLVGKEYTKANEEMLANSGIAKWKSMGYYDVDVSRPLETQVMKNASVADKFSEKGMKLAELADSATWASLWNACKKETAEKNKGLDSKALLEKTAERFNDIILRTQVVDSVLAKSQWMRSNSFWHRMTSAFMSEPLTSYNALLRQADKYARDVATKGAKFATKNNIKGIAKATTVFVFTQLLNALVTAPLDALRDDDDYETYLEKVLANFKENAVGNLMPWNMLPYVSDIMDYLLYGRTDRSDMAYAVNVIDLAKSIYNLADNYSYHKLHNTFNKALSVASQTSGFAVSNIWRDAVSVWNAVAGSLGYGELKFQTGADSKTAGYKKMYEALLDGDEERVGYLFGQLLSNGVEVDDIYSGLTKQVGEDVKSGKITDEEATERLKAIIDITGKVDSEGNAPTDNDVYWMIDKWHYTEENGSTEGYSKYDDIFTAMENGDPTTAIAEHLERSTAAYFAEAKAKAEKEGTTFNEKKAMKEAESKAESAIKSAVTSHFKPLYKEAYKNKDDEEMKRIRYMLRDTKLYGSTSDLLNTLKGWIQS